MLEVTNISARHLPGVYRITCTTTGTSYIGASRFVRRRLLAHLSLDGRVLRGWPGATAAANALGGWPAGINKCCMGKTQTAYGFRWQYLETPW